MVANITADTVALTTIATDVLNVSVRVAKMKINEIVDYFYGLDPAHMTYTHKVGKIYGKKNLKVPHAKLHKKSKRKK